MEDELLDFNNNESEDPPKKKPRKRNPSVNVSRIQKIILHEFRQFKDKEILIAKRLTVIAGHNATGKSTLLAVLANSCEFKHATPLIKPNFRGEFREIIKASFDHDPKCPKAIEILFADTSAPAEDFLVPFRTTWQDNNRRFRLIPKHHDQEGKLGYPIIYLGLSRLYPLGECSDAAPLKSVPAITSYFASHPDDKTWLIEAYKHILSQSNITGVDPRLHPDLKQKVFAGVESDAYNGLCNSSGQDNLGQILLAILSFKKLKQQLTEEKTTWHGGILLIDELDATLHPAAQVRLLDLLYKESMELDLQIVFTTHSLSMLEHFYKTDDKLRYKDSSVIYITTQNNVLSVKETPSLPMIRNDMLVVDPATLSRSPVLVLTEDGETRWFLEEILPERIIRQISMPEMTWGCGEIAKFNKQTFPALIKSLIVVDGDFDKKDYNEYNLLILPGNSSPEGIIYSFLKDLPPEHELLNGPVINKRTLEDYGPFSPKYAKLDIGRKKYKAWFRDNSEFLMELNVISFWKENNKNEIETFIAEFQNKLTNIKAMRRS
ncbi:AAA family ATPase [Selenomonas sp.]|uniref:AAA family ATPase n=1 Tax=Selenomonas sp. TaxID=2053611 RepID=UPI001CB44D6F|nr:AAA family ATPase [Selenomonas sp.]MBF1694673.1 AAA family ATPase [Selenomonas sp.]